jgi:ABC-type glycerol-3-phosphate transport system permease component
MSTKALSERFYTTETTVTYLAYAVAVLIALMILVPFVFVILISFKPPEEIFRDPLQIIPNEPTLRNWRQGYAAFEGFLWNSVIAAAGTTILALVITIPGAYAFGRKEFPGREFLFYAIVMAMVFPYIILVIPVRQLWGQLGLFNTFPGLWISHQIFVVPLAIWILRDFFQSLPTNLEEAAQVYGCTQFTAFLRVILPLSAPALAAVAFFAFLHGWNDFLFTNILTLGNGPVTATVKMYDALQAGTGDRVQWGILMAQALMTGLPPAVFYMFTRRYLTEAFAMG